MKYTVKRALALLIALLLALPALASAEDVALPAGEAPVEDVPADQDFAETADPVVAEPAAFGEAAEETAWEAAEPADDVADDAPDDAANDEPAEETADEPVAEANPEPTEETAEEAAETADEGFDEADDEVIVTAPAEPEVAEAPELELAEETEEADGQVLWESAGGLPEEAPLLTAELPSEPEVVSSAWDDGDNDALLDAYVQRMIDDSLGISAPMPLPEAGTVLTGMDSVVYDILKSEVTRVAAGELSSSVFIISEETLRAKGVDLGPWTAESLHVSQVIYNDNGITRITREAMDAISEITVFNLRNVIYALLADCPSELYWYNKTKGIISQKPTGMTVGGRTVGGEYQLYYTTSYSITISMSVSVDYQASGEYTVNADKVTTAKRALENAAQIVESNQTGSVRDRLTAYKNAICERVAYDHAAINNNAPYGDPWQLIHVFDGDPNTNVVCEGYAKAFKYLFDLSGFDDPYDCLLVVGKMNGFNHMWNIVHMEDGRNYLVDVTNCDVGSVGYPDMLFMMHNDSGSVDNGYTFQAGNNTVAYKYDDFSRATFTVAQLTLSTHAYDAVKSAVSIRDGIEHGTVSASPTEAYAGEIVTLTFTPESGYEPDPDSLTFSYDDGATQTRAIGANHRFFMPAYPVTVNAAFRKIPATVPTFSAQPQGLSLTYSGAQSATLHVDVNPIDGHELSYQWYVNGTNSATGGTAIDGATAANLTIVDLGVGTKYYYCTVTATRGDNGLTATATTAPTPVRVDKASLTVTAKPHAITYGDDPANGGVAYYGFVNGEDADDLGGTLAYEYSYARYGDVGEYAITPKGLTSDNYDITFVSGALTVNPKTLTVNWSETPLVFNGAPQAPEATLSGIVNGDAVAVAVAGSRTDAGTGYTATASLTGDKAGNYALPANAGMTFSIDKAAARSLGNVALVRTYAATAIETTVAGQMPDNAGALSYAKGTKSTSGSIVIGSWSVDAATGAVTATISGGKAGDTLALPVIISSTNYADSTITLAVTLVDKADAGVTIAQGTALTATYGDALNLSATAANPDGGAWTWSSSNPNIPVSDTGAVTPGRTGSAAITARYSSDSVEGSATLVLTVRPRSIAGGTLSLSQTRIAYDGTQKRVDAAVTLDGKALNGADYDLTGDLTGTAVKLYTVTATGKGNYADSLSATWSIADVMDPAALTPAQKPTAKKCQYTGAAQALLAPPAARPEGYAQVLYSLDDGATWSAAVPTATAPGDYAIRVRYVGDALHMDFDGARIVASIQAAPSTPAAEPPATTGGSAPAVEAPAPEPAVLPIAATGNVKAPAQVGKTYQINTGGKAVKGFKSSNKKVATVNADGVVIPKKPGKVKITFKVGKKKRTVTLTVTDPTIPKRIALTANGPLTGKKGGTVQLIATLPENTTSAVKWTSSNKKVATVNASGVVTFKKPGKATITATCKRGGKKAKVKVRVTK